MTTAMFRLNVEKFPQALEDALRQVAKDTAERVKTQYQTRLNAQLHNYGWRRIPNRKGGTWKWGHTGLTAASTIIVEDAPHHQFFVRVQGAKAMPPNLPLWLEFGTRFMLARPALRPAARAESDQYKKDMMSAAAKTAAYILRTTP